MRSEKPLICDHADNLICLLTYLRTDVKCSHRDLHEHVLGICDIPYKCHVCEEITRCIEVSDDNKKES